MPRDRSAVKATTWSSVVGPRFSAGHTGSRMAKVTSNAELGAHEQQTVPRLKTENRQPCDRSPLEPSRGAPHG